MKNLLCLSLLVLTGCVTNYPPQGCGGKPPCINTGYAVVNNTHFPLTVYQDGRTVCESLEPGQVLPIKPMLFNNRTVCIVTGHDGSTYVGTASWTFIYNAPEVWTVQRLNLPSSRMINYD